MITVLCVCIMCVSVHVVFQTRQRFCMGFFAEDDTRFLLDLRISRFMDLKIPINSHSDTESVSPLSY